MSLDTRAALRTRIAPAIGLAALAVGTMWLRTSHVSQEMWLLADQVRDWRVALLPWRELPGHGPPSIAGGYSFGPIFYWTLGRTHVSAACLRTRSPIQRSLSKPLFPV